MCHFALHLTEEHYPTLKNEMAYTKTQSRILALHGKFVEMSNPENLVQYTRSNASSLFGIKRDLKNKSGNIRNQSDMSGTVATENQDTSVYEDASADDSPCATVVATDDNDFL